MLTTIRTGLRLTILRNDLRKLPAEYVRNLTQLSSAQCYTQPLTYNLNHTFCRFKGKGRKIDKHEETETEEDEKINLDEEIIDKNTKLLNIKITSLRVDLVLKAGLGIARNKIETMFYESKVRLNGQKLLKKSATVNVGDEIDLIKGVSPSNPNFLVVARIELLSANEKGEGYMVKLRRTKALTIENYKEPWKVQLKNDVS